MAKWAIQCYRPNMVIMDSMRDPLSKDLKEHSNDRDYIATHRESKDHKRPALSWASLDLTPEEMENMVVARANAEGLFMTEDPVEAYLIVKELEKALPVNAEDLKKSRVTFKVEPLSDPIPTKEQIDKLLRERSTKKAS